MRGNEKEGGPYQVRRPNRQMEGGLATPGLIRPGLQLIVFGPPTQGLPTPGLKRPGLQLVVPGLLM